MCAIFGHELIHVAPGNKQHCFRKYDADLAPGAGHTEIFRYLEALLERRVLRGLIALGLCFEVEPDRYKLSELGQLLRSDHPRSLRARILAQEHKLLPTVLQWLAEGRVTALDSITMSG